MLNNAKWYVVHTYSGYENKVKANIEKSIENRNLSDLIQEIQVPLEEVVETKDGQKKVVMKKKFPSYVIVKMVMTDETWYIVRNTRGVTGFVGPGSKPVPLTEEEAMNMENFIGVVEEINMEKKKVRVCVSMFGRETPVELEFDQVETLV